MSRALDPARQLELELDQVERFTCPWCPAICCLATSPATGKRGVAHPAPACVTFKHTPAARIVAIVRAEPVREAS